jgi:glutaminyl-peptide cyclotransferase
MLRIAIFMRNHKILSTLILIVLVVLLGGALLIWRAFAQPGGGFNSQRAYNYVRYQLSLGPRTLGSPAHEETAHWIVSNLQAVDWQVELQTTQVDGRTIENIIAKKGSGSEWVILGSHYDSRSVADQDVNPSLQNQPVPGANDGASTVAILLELARVIPSNLDKQVWLVFFDDEDNGDNSGAGWSLGSQYFVSELAGKPDRVVILDMLGDKNLDIYMEQNSDPEINDEIWSTAKALDFAQFIPSYKYAMIDDHIPFIEAGIKAADIIDFDYPYWHTTQDTLDKISAKSLNAVGATVLSWLEQYPK